ncbi:MAG TPA: DNA-directed RNA polymerase subunit omega [Longimicrobiaceae bacterium]|nr:DNA-directed RNA polymerase subunit omega [Longimicrobiaceae bacterium]
MKVITPGDVARSTGSKYLGVLVAAKYARMLNEFRRGQVFEEPIPGQEPAEKLTTVALREVASGDLDFDLVDRRRSEV